MERENSLGFLKIGLMEREEGTTSVKGLSEKFKDSIRRGVSRDQPERELWHLSSPINYGEEVGITIRRGRNLLVQ